LILDIFLGVLVFVAGLLGILKVRNFIKENNKINADTLKSYETDKEAIQDNIKKSSIKEIAKKLGDYFKIIVIVSCFFSIESCKAVLILPEPPYPPKIEFPADESTKRIYLSEPDSKKLLEYIQLSEAYRKNLIKFIEGLK